MTGLFLFKKEFLCLNMRLMEEVINGLKPKNKELKISQKNYPDLSNDAFLLGPEWYLSIGHISLLGYLGIAYPKKFILLNVKGLSSANKYYLI